MGRTHLAKAKVAELKKNIEYAKERKEKLTSYLHELQKAYHEKRISYAHYIETLHKKHDGRNLHEHIHYYDHFIKESEQSIGTHKKHIHKNRSFSIFIFIIAIIALTFLFSQIGNIKLTGFFVSEGVPEITIEEQKFSQEINLETNESITYEWILKNQGNLSHVNTDGLIEGQGIVKVYLDDLLILDNSAFPNQKQGTIQESFFGISLSEENTSGEIVSQTKIINFSNICEETCDLSLLNLNKTSYILKIEINNAKIKIQKINYGILIEKSKTPEITPETNITNETAPSTNITNATNVTIITPQENITANITTKEYTESTTQLPAKLNEPVKWIKTISVKKQGKLKISLPKESSNIIFKEGSSTKQLSPSQIRAAFNETELNIDSTINEYEITYETPSPSIQEETISNGKRIRISSPDTIHYENITAFTTLSEAFRVKDPSKIKIKWVEQNSFISPSSVQDKDFNGIYDYIEWLVPSLSNQTFEIIVITKAEHLDNNRNFLSDIYDQVKTLDNIWSETIQNQHYVRVTFEKNLTSINDITIYPRKIQGNPRVEVYEFNKTVKIVEFANIMDNQYNQVFLTNLVGVQDTFDLKIIGGSVEFDHIIDPQNLLYIESESCLPSNKCTVTSSSNLLGAPDGTQANAPTAAGGWAQNAITWTYTMENTSASGTFDSVNITFYNLRSGSDVDDALVLEYQNGNGTWYILRCYESDTDNCGGSSFAYPTSNTNITFAAPQITSLTEVNSTQIRMRGQTQDGGPNNWEMYIDSVLLNVTTTSDIQAPKSQNPSVDDTTPDPSQTLSHNINWTDDMSLSYASLEVNSSGASCNTAANVTNTTISGTSSWANLTWQVPNACEGKTISWKQYANDSSNNWNSTSLQIYTVQNVNPTASFGTNPVDTYNSSSSSVTFDLKVSDNLGVSYLILYGNWSGSWIVNQTNSSPVNDTFWNVTVSGIPNGFYRWAAWGNDTSNNQDFTDTNRTLTIDTVAPTITLPVYVNGTQKQSTQTLTLNISVSDATTSPSACNIEVNGTNTTFAFSSGWCNTTLIPLTNLADGNKTIKIYANDSVNNWGLNNSFVVDIITVNADPTINNVSAIAATDPTIGTTKAITFNFTATDTDGGSTINTSSAQAYFQRAGESTRSNTSCINTTAAVGNNINFTCTINMWYFDQNGAWTINTTIKDNSDAYGENSTNTFTYNLLTAMVMSPTSLAWASINAGQTDTGSNNDPIVINNSGNDVDLNINVTAYNLRGEEVTTEYIYANNFTIENASQGCAGTAMSNATSINVTSAILQRGNNSLNYNNATSGQEQVYFCIKSLPSPLTPQSYSSSAYGAWEIRVLLVALIPRRRKKKKKVNEDRLVKALGLIMDELKEKYSLDKKETMSILIKEMKEKYGLNQKEIHEILELKQTEDIPSSIFSKELGALESLVKYLKENRGMNYKEISTLLSRNERTVWTAYKKAREKQTKQLLTKKLSINIPLGIFKTRKLTILESLVVYLKEKGLKYSEISSLIERDQRNIASVYKKAVRK